MANKRLNYGNVVNNSDIHNVFSAKNKAYVKTKNMYMCVFTYIHIKSASIYILIVVYLSG